MHAELARRFRIPLVLRVFVVVTTAALAAAPAWAQIRSRELGGEVTYKGFQVFLSAQF